MRTVKLTIAYDGTGFVGWQRQESGDSIQGLIEDALATIEGHVVTLHGAGRTDAGVHALAQVASARIGAELDDATLVRALNAHLPPAIRVDGVETVPDDFHARFSATGKTYEYRVWNGPAMPPFMRLYAWHVPQPLDLARMNEASRAIVGEYDFAAFQGTGSRTHSTVRRVTSAEWRANGASVTFRISGQGFLRHMVRSLAGTLIEVGHGRRPADDLARLVAAPERSDAGRTAPPHGLFLVSVL
ncbi:MAG TPA: tRNA pseudouridine(38-40) synthase TruA, partial [Vicinamibacterales bacterium]|nr:tRNA pseudouridine(38-40) synthase TruA [Vicinamibacterales bacterium]